MTSEEKIRAPAELLRWRQEAARNGEPLALVVGTFDLLQPGNLSAIQRARQAADRVCVLLQPDDVAAAAGSAPQHPLAARLASAAYLRDVAAVAALERRAAETLLAGLRPYLWITCSAQSAPEPQGELVCRNAADLVDIPPRAGCFTRDIHSAIRAGRTPLNLPADWQPAHPVARPACVGPRPLVTVNGCFDILHLGHLRFLEQARERGAALWILLNDDASVRRYKGPSRPVFPLAFRRDALLSLAAVDGVTPFPEDDPLRLLAELQPDIHVKGGSYEAARARRERELVASWGGRLDILPLIEGRSTSAYIRGVQNLNDKPSAMTG